jgi:hypothetical protein
MPSLILSPSQWYGPNQCQIMHPLACDAAGHNHSHLLLSITLLAITDRHLRDVDRITDGM